MTEKGPLVEQARKVCWILKRATAWDYQCKKGQGGLYPSELDAIMEKPTAMRGYNKTPRTSCIYLMASTWELWVSSKTGKHSGTPFHDPYVGDTVSNCPVFQNARAGKT